MGTESVRPRDLIPEKLSGRTQAWSSEQLAAESAYETKLLASAAILLAQNSMDEEQGKGGIL